jgi:hypothetical protein
MVSSFLSKYLRLTVQCHADRIQRLREPSIAQKAPMELDLVVLARDKATHIVHLALFRHHHLVYLICIPVCPGPLSDQTLHKYPEENLALSAF